jgi:hypothetical protein
MGRMGMLVRSVFLRFALAGPNPKHELRIELSGQSTHFEQVAYSIPFVHTFGEKLALWALWEEPGEPKKQVTDHWSDECWRRVQAARLTAIKPD